MIYIDEQTGKNIDEELRGAIRAKLLDGFQTRKFLPIVSVTDMTVNYDFDKGKSNRNLIVVAPVIIQARVMVNLRDNIGQASDWLNLRINSVEFLFDKEIETFTISNPGNIELIDMS